MDMNKVFFARKEDHKPRWRVIDAQGKIVGRLATEIADALRGKDKPEFTSHCDAGDYIVVVNADKIAFSSDKMNTKTYVWHTGWMGGQKSLTAAQMMEKDPTRIISYAVKGMLPKSRLGRAMFKKLKVYAGSEHPHAAQVAGEAQ